MKKKYNGKLKAGSREKMNEPRLVGSIIKDMLLSNESCAVAYRYAMYSDTHLGVDVKVLKITPGRLPVDATLDGTMVRDGEDHFIFIEKIHDKKVHRVPITWEGDAVNVHDEGNGVTYATLRRPRYTEDFTFKDFCEAAADELLTIARQVKEE